MDMNWDFGKRNGDLKITNFDTAHINGGLDLKGKCATPAKAVQSQVTTSVAHWRLNSLKPSGKSSIVQGFAHGSFVQGTLTAQLKA